MEYLFSLGQEKRRISSQLCKHRMNRKIPQGISVEVELELVQECNSPNPVGKERVN